MEENTNEMSLPTTNEELQALLQREGDRRVSEAMKTAERKKAAAIAEADKLARMDEEQRFKYEIEQRESALKEREEKLTMAENKVEATKILAGKGLPVSLVDLVVAVDADTMNERIKGLESAFTEAVKVEVESRLKSSSPITGVGEPKKNYSKMSLAEIDASFQK